MTPLKKYIWLVDTVMRSGDKGLTLEQIASLWNADDEMRDNGAFARRSFHRHRTEINDLFGIEIECYPDGAEHRYRIADNGTNGYFRQWLLDSIAVNRIVTDSREAAQYIAVESIHDAALPALLEALKRERMISFSYHPFWSETPFRYSDFRPHALKMFERRWYLIGRYAEHHRIFALDRMSDVQMQDETFSRDAAFSLDKMFEGCYGIIADTTPVEAVWLKVEAYQANYLRSLPLHPSQHEIKTTSEYAVFALRVRPTFDFKQKLLSLGSTVEVLRPASLRADMRGEIADMLNKYRNDDE